MIQLEKTTKMASVGALGAKTARCCDGCMKRRARWYCAADDAFLCQACDTSVHSANPLARRHERVRLKTASATSSTSSSSKSSFATPAPLHVPASFHKFIDADADEDGDELGTHRPAWHRGFKRKARTPRGGAGRSPTKSCCASSVDKDVDEDGESSIGGKMLQMVSSLTADPLVPDMDRASLEEFAASMAMAEEDQLLYRVPIFDPVLVEFCSPHEQPDSPDDVKPCVAVGHEDHQVSGGSGDAAVATPSSQLPGFLLPSDLDLAEFEMDVESLLGRGLDDDSFCMESLGLMDDSPRATAGCSLAVKKEEEDEEDDAQEGAAYDGSAAVGHPVLAWETFDISSFDCASPTIAGQMGEDQKPTPTYAADSGSSGHGQQPAKKRKIMLKLDYGAVITAWSEQGSAGSPWTNGERPKLDPDECWPDYTGMAWGGPDAHAAGYGGSGGLHIGASPTGANCDGGREARVSRYREKRRTRLFSKKIRYEVRKLNAEKRPRMKGRFVKRASFAAAGGAVSGAPTTVVGKVQYAY